MDYGGGDHLDGRIGLRATLWQRRSKSVCAGSACCGLGWKTALSVTTAPLKVICANAALYKWTFHLPIMLQDGASGLTDEEVMLLVDSKHIPAYQLEKQLDNYQRGVAIRYVLGRVTITTESSTDGATTLSRMNLSGYVEHVTIFSWMFSTACCLVVRLGLGLYVVSG